MITSKPERLVCPICEDTYSIPSNGTVKTYKETQCPLDNFDLLYFNGSKSFIFCPQCYNNPPFEDMDKLSACFKCTNDDCKFSLSRNTIGQCLACRFNGYVVLDQGSGPPTWKFSCTKCTFTMSLFKGATKLSIERDRCIHCQNNQIKIKYSDTKSKFENGMTDFKGCIWCSPELSSTADAIRNFSSNSMQNADNRTPVYRNNQSHSGSRGRGGRGRGSGNRGRGNHRGRGAPSRGRGGPNRSIYA